MFILFVCFLYSYSYIIPCKGKEINEEWRYYSCIFSPLPEKKCWKTKKFFFMPITGKFPPFVQIVTPTLQSSPIIYIYSAILLNLHKIFIKL